MALSGKTAAPIELPYYLGTDKPPSLAEATKTPADRLHALLEALGAKEVLNGSAGPGQILVAQPGDIARFKAMKGDATLDAEGNLQLGKEVVGANELGAQAVTLAKLATALGLPESYLAAAVQTKLNNERVPTNGSITRAKFAAGVVQTIRKAVGAVEPGAHLVKVTWPEEWADTSYTVSAILQLSRGAANSTEIYIKRIEQATKSLVEFVVHNETGGSLSPTLQVTGIHD